jgi:hypothetical protein
MHTLGRNLITALIMSHATFTLASDKAVTVFPAEGNKQCADYAANNLIIQMGTNSPQTSGVVIGSENPRDVDTEGESASYTVSDGKVVGFSAATTPVDFAILKSSRNVSVIIYPSGGVTADSNMQLVVGGVPQTVSAISLCYGLGNAAPQPPLATPIKSCNLEATLDQTGVSCPTGGRALVCNFELDQPFYGLNDGSDTCCVCNDPNSVLQECNPELAAGEEGACVLTAAEKADRQPPLPAGEVTTHIELNNDPYFCTTVAGIRKCYLY